MLLGAVETREEREGFSLGWTGSLAGVQSPVNQAWKTPENAAERVSIAGVMPGEDFQLGAKPWT